MAVLLGFYLSGEGLAEFILRDAGGPEAEAVREFFGEGGAVFGFLGVDDAVGLDLLDAGVGLDVDVVVGEAVLGEFGEGFVVGVEDVGAGLDDVDGDFVAQDARVEFAEVFVEHVVELGGEFDAGWAAAGDDEGEEAATLFVGGGGEAGDFEVSDDLVADKAGVADVFEKVAMLEAVDAVGVRDAADSDDQLVVGEIEPLLLPGCASRGDLQ